MLRDTRLRRSTSDCMRRNLGMVRPMSTPTTASSTRSATAMIHSRPLLVAHTWMKATMPMMGARRIMRSIMTTTICTCCTSLVQRVMSDDGEKRSTS